MEEMKQIGNVSAEVLEVLNNFDKDLIKKIPKSFIEQLKKFAIDSDCIPKIDMDKELIEQNITEESKDLISLIYYSYILNSTEKHNMEKIWNDNEKNYQKKLKEKYNVSNIFNKDKCVEKTNTVELIELQKEKWYSKLLKFIKKIIKK